MSENVERYKKLALRYLDVEVKHTVPDEAALLIEMDTLWWQMSYEEREIIEEWNTERGKA